MDGCHVKDVTRVDSDRVERDHVADDRERDSHTQSSGRFSMKSSQTSICFWINFGKNETRKDSEIREQNYCDIQFIEQI